MKPLQTQLSRRSVLSLAVLTGAFATLQPMIAQAVVPSEPSVPASDGQLLSVGPGLGVKKVHPDVFVTVAYLEQRIVTNPAGVPKLLTSQSGMTNQFQVVDAATGKLEFAATIPGKVSSNFGYNPATGTVYFGRGDGHLASWKFGSTTVTDLGKATSIATGIYAITVTPNGKLWGGSYPQGLIWSYTPATKVFTESTRIDMDTDYVRALEVVGDTVYAGTGSVNPKMVTFPASNPSKRTVIALPDAGASGFVSRITARGEKLFVVAEDSDNVQRSYVYNLRTAAWEGAFPGGSPNKNFTGTQKDTLVWGIQSGRITSINTATMVRTPLVATGISSARAIHTVGDRIYISGVDGTANVTAEYSIAAKALVRRYATQSKPGALSIQSLIAGAGGLLYFGGYQGNGLASLNPDTGARWRGVEDAGVNQIEHLMEYDKDSVFIGSYGSAVLYRYTPSQKHTGKDAFKLVANLREECMQSRPFGWAAAAGKVIVGTVPEYGHNGGALGIIDPGTNAIEVMDNFIDGRSIVGLHGAGDIVYGTTSNKGGYGTRDHVGESVVFAYNVRTRTMQWRTDLAYEELYSPLLVDGELVVTSINGVITLDPSTGDTRRTLMFRNRTAPAGYLQARSLQLPGTSKIVHNSGSIVTLIDLKGGTRSELGRGGYGTQMAVTPDGRLFVSSGGSGIAELHTELAPVVEPPPASSITPADLVTMTAAGTLTVEPSAGKGVFKAPVDFGGKWDRVTVVSFHIVDWNADGSTDILVQRTNGTLQLHRGRAEGGFGPPIALAGGTGWKDRRIVTGRWNNTNPYPSLISVDKDGVVRASQVNPDCSIGEAVAIGAGWQNRQFVMTDFDGDGNQDLIARVNGTLICQRSDGSGNFTGAERVVASGGWYDVTQLAGLVGHYSTKPGLLSVNRAGALRHISTTGTAYSGIVNYPGDRSGVLIAGSAGLDGPVAGAQKKAAR